MKEYKSNEELINYLLFCYLKKLEHSVHYLFLQLQLHIVIILYKIVVSYQKLIIIIIESMTMKRI